MLNIKTLIKMITKYGKNVYYEEINDYHLFTNNQILVFIKDGYDKDLCKTIHDYVKVNGFSTIHLKAIIETFISREDNINSIYKADNHYTMIDSGNNDVTWFSTKYLSCISKRYKGGKEIVSTIPTMYNENYRLYFRGDENIFVVILPIHKVN